MATNQESEENLVRLAYISKATDLLNSGSLQDIRKTSDANNARDQISGCLITDKRRIIQVVEGERSAINALMERIKKDSRHQNVKVFAESEVKTRAFNGWEMALVDMTQRTRATRQSFEAMLDMFESSPMIMELDAPKVTFFQNLTRWK